MGETRRYNLEKVAAVVVEYLSQGPALEKLPVGDTRKAIDDAQADGTFPKPAVDEAWVNAAMSPAASTFRRAFGTDQS